MRYKTLSIVIPIFNEEPFISKTIRSVLKSNSLGLQKEIILIDDGSTDHTGQKINSFVRKPQNKKRNIDIIIINKKKNEGKGKALQSGFLKSTGDIVLVQDADLEYNPDDYPALLEPFLKNEADVVYGSRFISDRPHRVLYFWHYLGNVFLTTFSNILTNLNLTDMETGYKVFRGDLIREVAKKIKSKRFGFEPEITARVAKIKNIKICEVGISYWGRTYQEGKKIGIIDGLKAIYQILRFNLFP